MKKLLELINAKTTLESADKMKYELDKLRVEMLSHDKSLLVDKGTIISFDDFRNAPDGRFSISHKGVSFDCLFKRNDDSDRLYVVFSGLRQSGLSEPTFKRWSYYKYMNGSMLNIDDPMCKIHKELELGWYYGNEKESYCDYIAEIVTVFAQQNNIRKTNIVFFASSGGGFAALYCACRIKGSMAVVINPQIKLELNYRAKAFTEITKISLGERDIYLRNHLPELIKSSSKESRFIFIENAESKEDILQLNTLCKTLGAEYNYGLSFLKPNILCWIYQAVETVPHSAMEYPQMFFAIEHLIDNFDNALFYSEIYLMLSELWYERFYKAYSLKKSERELLDKVELLDIYTTDKNSHAITKTLVDNKFDIVIPKEDKKYNSFIIYDGFDPETIYQVILRDVSVICGDIDKFTFSLKNGVTDKVYIKRCENISQGGVNITFKTGTIASSVQLKIYAGIAGKTNGNSLKISDCKLYKITIEHKK